jgi:hypothetical protein
VQNFARNPVGVNHGFAALHKNVAWQCFEEGPLLGRQDGDIHF